MVTVLGFSELAWALSATFGYRTPIFQACTGTISLLWLPYSDFQSRHGHHQPPLVTVLRFSKQARAPSVSFGYRTPIFRASTGTISLLWLPYFDFLSKHGHHQPPMVTVFGFSKQARVPSASYGSRTQIF
jgi:hypothetical protein